MNMVCHSEVVQARTRGWLGAKSVEVYTFTYPTAPVPRVINRILYPGLDWNVESVSLRLPRDIEPSIRRIEIPRMVRMPASLSRVFFQNENTTLNLSQWRFRKYLMSYFVGKARNVRDTLIPLV
jgi:hypothetical protein